MLRIEKENDIAVLKEEMMEHAMKYEYWKKCDGTGEEEDGIGMASYEKSSRWKKYASVREEKKRKSSDLTRKDWERKYEDER